MIFYFILTVTVPPGYVNVTAGAHIMGGTLQPGTFTEDVCIALCTGTATCESVDFDSSTRYLWIEVANWGWDGCI